MSTDDDIKTDMANLVKMFGVKEAINQAKHIASSFRFRKRMLETETPPQIKVAEHEAAYWDKIAKELESCNE